MQLPRRLVALLLLSILAVSARADAADPAAPEVPERWLQGYVRTVAGETLVYQWAYPGQVRTLLSRATDGSMTVEWEGEAAPAGPADAPVTYLWHAGLNAGVSSGHRFTLAVNGRPIATLLTRSVHDAGGRAWTVAGAEGATVSFLSTRVGSFDELFGFMWITAPRALVGDGAPRFSVTGEAAGSQDYYLGAEQRVEEWTRVVAEEALLADGRHAIRVGISNIGPERQGVVRSGDRELWAGSVPPGHTSVLLGVKPGGSGSVPPAVPVSVTLDGTTTFDGDVALAPVRLRAIHLLPHSHVDIGYSDPQPEVERKQWQNLRDAVALGLETASYPPEARFRWNVEGLWSVESYLNQASPTEREAFAAAVRAGTIGIQANYTNILTGLATPEELRRWTDAHVRIQRDFGIEPGRSAMHSDIPGLSWTVVSALASAGVRYFSSGPNYMPGLADGGDRIGGTLQALGDRPFWWTSPSGEDRLLFWMAGRGYSWFHGLNAGRAPERGRDSILEYARALTDAGYPYDLVQVRYTIGGDNGPVDRDLPDFVRRWNEQFASPRLVIDTTDAMFAELERRHGAGLPVMSGDMTPYWEDGALSTAAEEVLARAAARRLRQAETLATLTGVRLPPADVAAAWRSVLLWHEHTWGAADSVNAPDRADVAALWTYKRQFAVDADRSSRALLRAARPPSAEPGAVDVVNTTSWRRSGLVLLPADLSRAGDRVLAGRTPFPSQRLRDGQLAVWIDDVPPLASVRLRVVAGVPAKPAQAASIGGRAVDSGRVRLVVGEDGALERFAWAGAPGHEFSAGAGIFQYLYVDGLDPAAARAGSGGAVTIEDAGPLVATLSVDAPAGGARSSRRRFRVVAGSDLVFAEIGLDKLAVRTKESGHLAFPLVVPGGVVRADQGEALVRIGRDQLPGSCRDFIGVQSAIDVSGASLGVSLVSLDAPLVELGAITDERRPDGRARRWRSDVAPGTTLYAYLFNNYWHTNYKAEQAGPLSFRFVLAPHAAFDPVALRRLSDEQDFPLLAVGVGPHDRPAAAPFTVESADVLVSSLRRTEAGDALAAVLHNPTDEAARVTVRASGRGARVSLEGVRGAATRELQLVVPARGTRRVSIRLASHGPGR